MNNDANNLPPAPFHPTFDRFMIELIDMIHTDDLETISPADAQRILDAMPEGGARAAMRDTFRDNIIWDDIAPPLT